MLPRGVRADSLLVVADPGSSAVALVYQVCMLASNVAALAGGYYMIMEVEAVPGPIKAIYALADVGVCLGRQRHALKDAGLIGSKSHAH